MKRILHAVLLLAFASLTSIASADPVVWQYDPSAKTITDGNWTISVAPNGDPMGLTLYGTRSNDGMSSVLDLGDAVCSDGSSTYTITRTGKFWNDCVVKPTEVILPKTLIEIGNEAFKFSSDPTRFNPCLQRLYIESDSLKIIGDHSFSDCGAPEDTTILAPNLETIKAAAFWVGGNASPKITNDVSRVIPRGVKFIGNQAFANQSKMSGDLVLDQLESIGSEFFSCNNNGVKKITSITLRSKTITSIPNKIFYFFESPTRLEVDMPLLETLGTESFSHFDSITEAVFNCRQLVSGGSMPLWAGNSQLTNLVLTSFCPVNVPGTVDQLLFSVNADYKCRLSVDKLLGWKEIAEPLTEAERARADFPGPATFGTYKVSAGKAKRVWLVHSVSPYREQATLISIR